MTEPYNRFPNWSTGFYEKRIPKRFGITKAIRQCTGDGWKDTGREGDVSFAYSREMRAPYAAGLFMVIGNPMKSVSVHNCKFAKPTIKEIYNLIVNVYHDLRHNRKRLQLMFGPFISFAREDDLLK